ncbi:MAG: D-alanyl-D-alanine carboxypeptidase [Verrucomicrobiae bacterium]|nr:D-alanyl-D-alanine carboxypeptidase [Verrucomicrobiae bacterium]
MSVSAFISPFSRLRFRLSQAGATAVLALGLFGCQSNEQAVYRTPPQVSQPGAAPRYPDPSSAGFGASSPASTGSLSGSPGSVEAPQPTPISFSGSPAASRGAPTVTARAAILVDGFGRVLFEKNADAHLPAASTQKLLIGLLVSERGNLSAPVTIQEADTWAEPTVMGIKPGEVYTRDQLLHAVLVRSCNDIARALGRDHSGSESAFVANLNAKARQLGMNNSYFTNSNGLPSPPGAYSTARDLSRLGFAALRNPTVRQICGSQSYSFRMANGTVRTLTNTNQVLRHFPYCTGLKTGTTNAAGRCLVSSATANGKTVVAVILGGTSPAVWQESEALLRYGLGM